MRAQLLLIGRKKCRGRAGLEREGCKSWNTSLAEASDRKQTGQLRVWKGSRRRCGCDAAAPLQWPRPGLSQCIRVATAEAAADSPKDPFFFFFFKSRLTLPSWNLSINSSKSTLFRIRQYSKSTKLTSSF